MPHGFRTWIAFCLVFSLIFTGPGALLFAQDESISTAVVPDLARKVEDHAGGWGLLTPLILFGSRAVESAYEDGSVDWGEAGGFVQSKTFWKGLAGDLTFALVAGSIASAMPGGALLRSFVAISGGFIGWEVGTGNFANTDWVNILGQVVAAGVVQTGLAMLGVPALVTTIATIAAAIGTGILIDHIRGKNNDLAEDAPRAPPAGAPAEFKVIAGDSKLCEQQDPVTAAQMHEDSYRRLVENLRRNKADEQTRAAWDEYRKAERSPHTLRELVDEQ